MLLAPGDPRPPGRRALVLLDARPYDANVFTRIAREVVAGPGVLCETTATGTAFRVAHPDALGPSNALDAHVLFFAATDTDVKTLAPVARCCRQATFVAHTHTDDSGTRALKTENLPYVPYAPGGALPTADAALLASDWSVQRREFIRRCRRAGVPTLSLQEAVNVDFDGPLRRMRWADAVCISGPQTLRYLARDVSFITGNPRFDGHTPTLLPAKPMVLINCNFILGLGGERGPAWMKQVLDVVQGLGVEFRVTKHPRDDTDLANVPNVIPSGAYSVRDQLAACSVLISRDSSLPYEALLSGRPVIYFDPFQEPERTLREDDTGLIRKCDTADGLRNALLEIVAAPPIGSSAGTLDDPYTYLFTERGAGSVDRVVRALHAITRWPLLYRTSDAAEDSGVRAMLHEWTELYARPRLRRLALLRKIWRAARKLAG
jgi:hypothetical protein